jgi:hypothetical protein
MAKKLHPDLERAVETQIKSLLHASRDCLRNRGYDTTKTTFSVNDGYYGEAFGIMRCLELLNYGYFGPDNLPDSEESPKKNLKWWFHCLTREVLKEENFDRSNKCDHCLEKWGKDGAGRIRGQQ